MTTRRDVVADDIYGTINDRRWELEKRLRKGTLNPEKVAAGLQQLLESCSWPKFPVWRTITHRGRRNAESYRTGLASTGCKADNWVNDILGRFETTSINEEVDLGCASAAELGFKESTRFYVICDRIVAIGHELCLPEDGPVLREQYLEQPMKELVRLAMKAIRGADGDLSIFRVAHDGRGLWLNSRYGDPGHLFSPDVQFVFRLCKRPLVA